MTHLLTEDMRSRAWQLLEQGNTEAAEELLVNLSREYSNDPRVWMMLSSVYGQKNRLEEVVRCCQQVIKINPQISTAHSHLGSAMACLGQHEQALAHLQQAVSMNPGDSSAHYNLAKLYLTMHKLRAAAESFSRVVSLNPGNYQAKLELAKLLATHGSKDEARGLLFDVLQAHPDCAECYSELGFMENDERNLDQAIEYFHKALSFNPAHYSAQTGIASAISKQGKDEEAYKLIRDLIDKGTATALTLRTYSGLCRDFGSCDEVLELAKKLDGFSHLPIKERSINDFTLGSMYHSVGNYDNAFRHYARANDDTETDFEPSQYTELTTRIINSYPAGHTSKYNRATVNYEEPVFIFSMPRSGSSLTEQILSRHSAVYAAGELNHLNRLARGGDARKLLGLEQDYPEFGSALTSDQLNKIASEYIGKVKSLSQEASRIVDKMPSNYMYLGLMAQMFPHARFIHCMRDPRDSCLSMFFQDFRSNITYTARLDDLAHTYNEYVRLMQHWERVLDIPILHIRYEDTVSHFEPMVRKLINFVGLDWEEDCLSFYEADRTVFTASNKQVRKPLYTSAVARWKRYEKHIESLCNDLAPAISYYDSHKTEF